MRGPASSARGTARPTAGRRRGYQVFDKKARCTDCHTKPEPGRFVKTREDRDGYSRRG